jgi:hypothetical protein
VTRALTLRSLLSALAASAVLAGCGGGAVSATKSTHSVTVARTGTNVAGSARAPGTERQSAEDISTVEERREYDANESRCHDDGGSVRNVGMMDAYCAFPIRANDFHLLETAHGTELSGEEE